ncbi:hypothetical protein GLUCORHAEAF1_17935, partial [Komagataeibacter rhaeticus AF1]|uniref:YfdX family protein n=1 Tax=Komagataeibacter rhaeticus TaxID=215221 RepID=UPI0004D45315
EIPVPDAPMPSVQSQPLHVPFDYPCHQDNHINFSIRTLEPSSTKATAVSAANTSLNKNQPAQAAQNLQVAAVDVDFVLAIAPLDASASDVYRATNLLAGKDTKGADNALQEAQNSIRFVSEDMVGTPDGQQPQGAGKGKKAAGN